MSLKTWPMTKSSLTFWEKFNNVWTQQQDLWTVATKEGLRTSRPTAHIVLTELLPLNNVFVYYLNCIEKKETCYLFLKALYPVLYITAQRDIALFTQYCTPSNCIYVPHFQLFLFFWHLLWQCKRMFSHANKAPLNWIELNCLQGIKDSWHKMPTMGWVKAS